MTNSYNSAGDLKMSITDLANACKNKTQAEVTKDFVKAASSFILSAGLGGAKGKKAAPRKGETLWDPKQLSVDQLMS